MRKLHFFSTLVALSLATTNLWADGVPEGAIKGKFSINSCGDQVYFSQGNLQYQASSGTWRFATNQYDIIGNNPGNTTTVANGRAEQSAWIDLFGWGTGDDPTFTNGKKSTFVDWGINAISNGGNTANSWRTLDNAEWSFVFNTGDYSERRQGAYRYAYAQLGSGATDNLRGFILFPDDYNPEGLPEVSSPNTYTMHTFTLEQWGLLENAGCVFLPHTGMGYGEPIIQLYYGRYWCTNGYGNDASVIMFDGNLTYPNLSKNNGFAVRLVQDVVADPRIAPVIDPPTAKDLTYTPSDQNLVNNGTTAYRCVFRYSFDKNSERNTWSWSNIKKRYAGVYRVYYYVDGTSNNSCYLDSDIDSLDVTIAKASFTSTPAQPITVTASWTYDNITRDLLTPQTITSPYGATIQYSTDDGNTWSTTVPQGHDAGTYTVKYKVVRSDPDNYEDYIPSTGNPFTVVVSKASYTPTGDYSVVANALTYIPNTPQQLVSVTGSVTNGTIYYKVGDGDWSTEIPTATTAGAYSVSYKVVPTDPNYEEYVPAASPIAVNIEKANIDLSGVTLPVSPSTIPYEGTPQNLIEIDPVADCTIWYKLGEGDWTTTPPAATDAANYSVQYKIVPDDSNYNTYGPETVTVTIVDYPTITDLTADDATIASILTGLTDPWQLKVKRIIYADGEYNTICLPFAVSASDLANDQYPLYGYERLKTLKGAKVTGSGRDLSIDIIVEDVDHMEAGKPYLISYPSAHADIVNPVFQLSSTTSYEPHAGSVTVDGVTFQGMFAQVHIDPYTSSAREQDFLFLGANSQLMWPEEGDASYMSGLRAYFIIDRTVITPAAAPSGTRARFVNAPKQPTSIENTELNTQAQKLLENGQLIILKNGIKYNAQGQVLK